MTDKSTTGAAEAAGSSATNLRIEDRLASADRNWQFQRALFFLLRTVKYAVIALLALFLLDLIFQLPSAQRLAGSLLYVVAGIAVAGFAVYIAIIRRSSYEKTARLLEDREPQLGSKLINILQLREKASAEDQSELTRSLARQAVDDAANEVGHIEFSPLVREPGLRRAFLWALGPVLAAAILLIAFHRISGLEFARYLDPFGDHPAWSFTTLEIVSPEDDTQQVTYKENLLIKCQWKGHEPKEVFITAFDPANPEAKTTLPMYHKGELGFVQQLENIQTDLVVFAHTKHHRSSSKQRKLSVLLTPRLENAYVTVSPPSYTGKKPRERPFNFKGLQVLKDSEIAFRLESNRPLKNGNLHLTSTSGPAKDIALVPAENGENPDQVHGSMIAGESGRLSFRLTDIDDIPSDQEWTSSFTVTHDLPPSIAILEPESDSFIVETFNFDAKIQASDDFGVKTIRVHRALNGIYSAPLVIEHGIPGKRSDNLSIPFPLADLGVSGGDTISIFAEAIDTCPDPHLVRSKTIHLNIIGEDEYNEYLREQFDLTRIAEKYHALLDEFYEELARQEEISKELAELQKAIEDRTADPELTEKKVAQLLEEQRELNEELAETADKMDGFVRENPVYDIESEIGERLEQRAEEIRESIAENQKKVDETGLPNSLSGTEQLNDFQQASDEQLERLGGVKDQAEEEIAEALEDAAQMQELAKNFNHFQELYEQQESIAEQSKAYDKEGELSEEDKLAMQQLAAQQREIAQQLEQLGEDLEKNAEAAKENHPEAAEAAQDLAHKIDSARMPGLGRRGAQKMVEGDGQSGHEHAEKLRSEMESICKECQGGMGEMAENFNQGFGGRNGMNPGQTFQQMMRSRNFGFGRGMQQGGQGQGIAGTRGGNQPMAGAPQRGLMGGESNLQNPGPRGDRPGEGIASSPPEKSNPLNLDPANNQDTVPSQNRDTEAVQGGNLMEQYRGVVDAYFKSITTSKEKP